MEKPFKNLDKMPESLKSILDPMGKDRPAPKPITLEELERMRPEETLGGSFNVEAVIDDLNKCPDYKIPLEPLYKGQKVCPNCEYDAWDHSEHGRGCDEFGPDDPDCVCRNTEREVECSEAGCGFCSSSCKEKMRLIRIKNALEWARDQQKKNAESAENNESALIPEELKTMVIKLIKAREICQHTIDWPSEGNMWD
jgi:hypothetical protein